MPRSRPYLQAQLRRIAQLLPRRSRLRVLANLELREGRVDPEILHLPDLLPAQRLRVALDIGANQGVMTHFLSRRFATVHAFEPNPSLTKVLRQGAADNVRVWPVAVSDRIGTRELRVPVVKGVVLGGWGSLEAPSFEAMDRVESSLVQTVTLDSLRLENVDFIKIDVERHELDVLRGAVELMQRSRPWLTVEVWEPFREEVTAFMRVQGYKSVSLEEIAGVPGAPSNIVFVPGAST